MTGRSLGSSVDIALPKVALVVASSAKRWRELLCC